jgi:hypothetical protein
MRKQKCRRHLYLHFCACRDKLIVNMRRQTSAEPYLLNGGIFMTGAYGAYISTEAFCLVFSLVLLFRLKYGLGSEREIRILRTMFIWYIVLLATDMLWAMTEDNVLVPPKLINGAINAAADMAISWGCYYWYRFVAERSGRYSRLGKTAKVLLALPTAAISVMLAASVFTGWMFFFDEHNHFHDTQLVYLRVYVNYFYLLLASGYSIYGAIRSGSRQKRLEYLGYVLYVLASAVIYYSEEIYFKCPLSALYIFMAMLILYLTIYVDRETEILKQREELTRSRVDIMRSQIQPHFLYNTLSAIQNLCHGKAPEAEEALVSFSKYLRGNLDSLSQSEPIPFERELSHTREYLALEQKRFGERLMVEYDVRATEFNIPALSLQPMAENAVQHGVMERAEGGTVRISSEDTGDAFIVRVADDGVGFDVNVVRADGRSHVGIANVRSRLEQTCGGSLNIRSVQGQGTEAVIRIPKERRDKNERADDGR